MPETLVARLFRVMRQRYGTSFLSYCRNDDDMNEARATWGSMLANCTPDEIRFALEIIGDHYQQFPPNVYQFRELCKAYKPKHASHRMLPSPVIKKADERTYKKFREQIRKETGI